jgi:BirA family transcriptional regulator, biotin operon repressor / biotin---[acetyl-CoA-carboxylase] ligase
LTGSTNADLLVRVREGAPEGLWLRADAQDGGRGRMGRQWDSTSGNLYASTIVRLHPGNPDASSLAFVAGRAAFDTIQMIAPDVAIQLKWPNDVMTTNGAKICGILLERTGDAVVAGFGLNLRSHPKGLDRPVSDLLSLGANPPPAQAVVEILAECFAQLLLRWRTVELPSILRAWDAVAHARGKALSVKTPDGVVLEGLYAGLSDDGALRLSLADGDIRVIHAADIFLI